MGRWKMRWLDDITDLMDMSLSEFLSPVYPSEQRRGQFKVWGKGISLEQHLG